jgi:hypothetical protein
MGHVQSIPCFELLGLATGHALFEAIHGGINLGAGSRNDRSYVFVSGVFRLVLSSVFSDANLFIAYCYARSFSAFTF